MKNLPLVSIIIPTLNRANLISETLDSVLAQTYQNWECIIVDDGSTDNTDDVVGEYVKKDSRFKFFHRPDEHLPGGNGARNFGFKMSKGVYVNWFDSDDLMLPEKIELKIDKILSSDYDFVVCEGAEIDSQFNIKKKWDKINSNNPVIDHIYGNLILSTNGPLFKKSLLLKTDMFREELKKKQEWEYFTRILLNNPKFYSLKKTLYFVKKTSDKKNHFQLNESKIKANIMVFNLIKYKKKNSFNHEFKRHFLHKFIFNFKIAFKQKKYSAIYLSLLSILKILDFEYFKNYIRKSA